MSRKLNMRMMSSRGNCLLIMSTVTCLTTSLPLLLLLLPLAAALCCLLCVVSFVVPLSSVRVLSSVSLASTLSWLLATAALGEASVAASAAASSSLLEVAVLPLLSLFLPFFNRDFIAFSALLVLCLCVCLSLSLSRSRQNWLTHSLTQSYAYTGVDAISCNQQPVRTFKYWILCCFFFFFFFSSSSSPFFLLLPFLLLLLFQ